MVPLIRHVIINQGSQEEEQRSIQKPPKKSPIPLAEKVGPATKTGLEPPAGLHLSPPHFDSCRGKKDKKSERSRDKREHSISRKRSHKDEDRIRSKAKSTKVTLT